MTSIIKATVDDYQLVAKIGIVTFKDAHGNSALETDINTYVDKTYNYDVVKAELSDPKNIYHIIYYDKQPAGYTKLILNATNTNIQMKNVAKLDRLYLLKEFYNLKLGFTLHNFNIELCKTNNQVGMWLYV